VKRRVDLSNLDLDRAAGIIAERRARSTTRWSASTSSWTTSSSSAASWTAWLPRGVSIPDEKPQPVCVLAEIDQQIPRRLRHPLTARVCGDPGQVHPAPIEFDDEQHIPSGPAERLQCEDITRQDAGGLAARELSPGWATAAWCRSEPVPAQDTPYRGGRDAGPRSTSSRTRRANTHASVQTTMTNSLLHAAPLVTAATL
jgi:hypothetical protein